MKVSPFFIFEYFRIARWAGWFIYETTKWIRWFGIVCIIDLSFEEIVTLWSSLPVPVQQQYLGRQLVRERLDDFFKS